MTRNRHWTLAARPEGKLAESDFAMCEGDLAQIKLCPGEILVRNRMFAVAPTIRNWLKPDFGSTRGSIPIGGTIRGMTACEVVETADTDFPVGTRMIAMAGWQDWSVIHPARLPVPPFRVPDDMDFATAMGPLSLNSLTAYFGLIEIGRPVAGETVVVSGAAGSVGAVVSQIARILGCRVIGIAGGPEKCGRVAAMTGQEAIDYRSEDISQRLGELCPEGVDLFFDNVGAAQLHAALNHMAPHGRIVVCGQISTYDESEKWGSSLDMMKVVYGRIRMEGFVVGDFVHRADEARAQLSRWLEHGQLTVAVDLREGLQTLPGALVDLFRGANTGTVLVAND